MMLVVGVAITQGRLWTSHHLAPVGAAVRCLLGSAALPVVVAQVVNQSTRFGLWTLGGRSGKRSGVMPTPNPDPLFWPLLFVALIVGLSYWAFVMVVRTMSRKEAGNHPQQAMGGSNFHDASSHSTTKIGKIDVKVERPGTDG